jgi:small subunit ribosomal protein S7
MPRRREIPKRELAPDPLYSSTLVSKFINTVMSSGKRSTAERILYKSFDIIRERTGDDPLKVFKKAVDNVKPSLEVKSRRVGGSNYQVPIEVNPNRRLSLSIRWLVTYARSRGDGKTMQEKFANELLDASNLRGGAVSRRPSRGCRRSGWRAHRRAWRPPALRLPIARDRATASVRARESGRVPAPCGRRSAADRCRQ